MKTQKQTAAEWWAGLPVRARSALRNIAKFVLAIRDGDIVRLTMEENDVSVLLICHSSPLGPAVTKPRVLPSTPQAWWRSLSAAGKKCFRELWEAVTAAQVGDVVEIRRGRNGARSRLVPAAEAWRRGPVRGRVELN